MSYYFYQLASTDLMDFKSVVIPKNQRNDLVDDILKYYKIHIGDFGEVKSLEIFKHIFRA
ncbi:MAG TPA: hypothetical protein DCX89_00575 [Saprospirales bacterium]|nr:hypothetical protein [Saprospirales bacterium]